MNERMRVHSLHPSLPAATHGVGLHFCITCLGRGYQLKRALPVNLLTAWRIRKYVRYYVVLFEGRPENATEHAALKKFCSEVLDIFQEGGPLDCW